MKRTASITRISATEPD